MLEVGDLIFTVFLRAGRRSPNPRLAEDLLAGLDTPKWPLCAGQSYVARSTKLSCRFG